MKLIFRLFFLLTLLIITTNSVQAKEVMPDITADNKSYDFSTGEWLLTGNVSIRSEK